MAFATGSKISSHFSHRGYNGCANLLRKTLPARNIAIKLNPDATFEFPYGDGYWSKLLNRSYRYEDELELLFRGFRRRRLHAARLRRQLRLLVGAGFERAVWVRTRRSRSSRRRRIFAKLKNNAEINGNRFEAMKCAIGAGRGTARLSGTKHEAFSIAGAAADAGEDVPVIALDNLIDDGKVAAVGKYLIKLDVEGVEIEAIKGGARLLASDSVILCEEHGNDPYAHGVALHPRKDAAKADRLRSAQPTPRNRQRAFDPRPHQGFIPRRL